ncbi:MAG: hypothetical protein KIT31_30905 [Deltaproteobacteria bacterium]|nr:hypothetical protein [Deltaproteobacteria bacterium]
MRAAALILLTVACGPKAVAPPVQVAEPPAPRSAGPAQVTCADAAVLLRGTVEDRVAGTQKEQLITRSCVDDKWPAAVLACVGGQAQAGTCLDQLAEGQRDAYGRRLATWLDAHPNESLDRAQTGWEPPPPPRLYTCHDGLGDPALYAPEVTLTGADRDFVVGMRKAAIFSQCTVNAWEQDALRCLQDPAAVQTCRGKLSPASHQALADELARVDAQATKTFEARKKPANLDCKKVVLAHYADAAWVGKLTDYKPADRAKAIADSRAAMTKACVDEKWDELARACVVGLGGAQPACFAASGRSSARWSFPALEVSFHTGIAECDVMLGHLHAMSTCDKAPQQMRDSYQQSTVQLVEAYRTMTPDVKANAHVQCKAIEDALQQAARTLGCAL